MTTPSATRRHTAGALVLFAVSLLAHAADNPKPALPAVTSDTILVTVNGQPVRRALFDALVKSRIGQANPYDELDDGAANKTKSTPPINQKGVFEDLLKMEILAQEARKRGMHLRPEIIAEAELQYKTLLQQLLVTEIIAEIQIAPAEILARYQQQKPEHSFKVSHILLKSEQEAKTAIGELDKGAKFQTVAHKRTLDMNTRKDGMLGWMMANQLEKSFVSAVEQLAPGSYSRTPVQTQYGWHVVQLHATRDMEKPPLATAQTWLRQEILYEKVNARIQQIRQAAKVDAQAPK